MPELRTDDGPRKLRAVWLGPKGATLPFEWTYVQWSVVLVMMPVGVLVTAAVIVLIGAVTIGHAPWFTWWIGIIYGAPAGVYLGVRIMRGVTFDEPLRYKVQTAREELGRFQTPAEAATNWRMPFPMIRYEADALLAGHSLPLVESDDSPEEDERKLSSDGRSLERSVQEGSDDAET